MITYIQKTFGHTKAIYYNGHKTEVFFAKFHVTFTIRRKNKNVGSRDSMEKFFSGLDLKRRLKGEIISSLQEKIKPMRLSLGGDVIKNELISEIGN